MKFLKQTKLIYEFLCLGLCLNICCGAVNAENSGHIREARFVNNPAIIEKINEKVDFKTPSFKSLWKDGRGVKSTEKVEDLTLDTKHILYTVQLLQSGAIDEIFISIPITSNKSTKFVGSVFFFIRSKEGNNPTLLSVIDNLCNGTAVLEDLVLPDASGIQYSVDAPDDSATSNELSVEFEKIESWSAYKENREKLESAQLLLSEEDNKGIYKRIDNNLTYIKDPESLPTYLLVNILWDDEDASTSV